MSLPPPDLPERKPSASPEKPTQQNSVPKPDDAQGLKKFIRSARAEAKRGGDVNVANLGDGAQVDQIAVGRNILQAKINIGSLVIPVRFLLALLAVALVIAIAAWWIVTPDKMPSENGAFNIAVADFGVTDAQGNVSASSDASAWSKWMFDSLASESKQLPQGLKVTVWHDSLFPFQERAHIGLIQGKTIAAREQAAEQKARELNADLVIYGNFATDQPPGTFVPEFYLAKSRNEADEMRGSQAMGKPFVLPSPVNPADQLTRKYLERNLTPRAIALAWFVPGLLDDLAGNFENAYRMFDKGLNDVENFQDDQGKAVFYYFKGQEALFLSQFPERARAFFGSENPGITGVDPALNAAADAFRRAQALDANYARAHFGQGSVLYQRANLILTNTFPEDAARADVPALLQQAIQAHQRALELARNAPGSLMEQQATLQLGFDYYQLGRAAVDAKNYADAERALQQARAQLLQGLDDTPQEQYRIRAQVYGMLARTAYLMAQTRLAQNDRAGARAEFSNADSAFAKCVAESNLLVQDEYLQNFKTACENGGKQVRAELEKLN